MTIRNDLSKRIHDRLYDWARDSATLYGMGGLGSRAITEDILTSIVSFLVAGIVTLDLEDEPLYRTMHEMVERRRAREAEAADESD